MTQLTMGANIPLPTHAVRATLSWQAGPGVPDVDVSALLLGETGDVGSDADFVFYNQPVHASGSVRLAGKTPAPQASDPVDIDLAAVPKTCRRVVLAASCDGSTFGQVPGLTLTVTDSAGGRPIAVFPMQADTETAFVTAELYRHGDGWKFRAVGQGYASGLAGLAGDFGISVGQPPTPPPTPLSNPPAPPAPAAAPTPPPAAVPRQTPRERGYTDTSGSLLDLDTPL